MRRETGLGSSEVRTLADVPVGGCVRIVRVGGNADLCRRMLDMGLVRGVPVRVLRNAPLRDPLELEVKGARLALRRREAGEVEVEDA